VATGSTTTLNFNTSGSLTNSPSTFGVTYTPSTPNGSASPITMTLDYASSTQYGQGSTTTALTNDGYTSGNLSAMSISPTGIIQVTYSNGQTQTIGQVALANFANSQGLQPMGNNRWAETYASGPSQLNAPGSGNAGTLRASALEASNVDLTTELVNMISAQRYYQANAQTIKTQDTVMQTLVNL
jgi:flagellar hook protein FlgE